MGEISICMIVTVFVNDSLNVKLYIYLKNAFFWDITPCSSCKNRCFIGMYRLHHQGDCMSHIIFRSVFRLLVNANVVPSSPILVTLMMEAIGSSETSVLTTATRRSSPEDSIPLCHRRENLRSYMLYIFILYIKMF
jgi:hypothetical protein